MRSLLRAAALISLLALPSIADGASEAHETCTPAPASVRGHPAVVECGPATASVKLAGRTLIYRGGTCLPQGASFSLYIGVRVKGGVSNRLFYVYLPRRAAPRYTPDSAQVGLELDYVSYRWRAGLLKIKPRLSGGTFTGTLVGRSGKPAGRFSGSFSC
jgi:hypothetical protein